MLKIGLKLLLVVPMIVWVAVGLSCAFGGFAIHDKISFEIWTLCGAVPVIACLVGCIFRRTRWMAVVSLLVLIVAWNVTTGLGSHRLSVGIRQLEAVYQDVAAKGQPFPQSIDRASYENPAYLHWYYQKNSETSFAIVYIVASDGWAMEYPDAKWRSIMYCPDGYQPVEPATATAPASAEAPRRAR